MDRFHFGIEYYFFRKYFKNYCCLFILDFERRTRVRLVIWEEGHAPCLHGLPAVELKVNTMEQVQGTQYNGTCIS